jgi:arsenate reductase (thioredoxin)
VTPPLRLLFVCVENSCRSQMAEAFARRLGGAAVHAASAGSRPSGVVNPRAIASMREVGIELAAHASKSLQEVAAPDAPPFDVVVTMGCGDACPWVPSRRREDWQIPDPRDMQPAEFARVRDEIEAHVQALLAACGVQAVPSRPARPGTSKN